MFLKSLEIRGFKSFADKTDLNFKNGVTAVVGPNGSGKSNISDAVRWVLGEQSVKSLRGGKMEDVIFAGTQFRKPVGLAQVSLTFDNSDDELPIDYRDVTISRRLYRSGDSEYYINNTQCRLRDILELFMDTGIGKEGYSIIGQGKIDAILSGKAEDRRNLLEEAAGIVKFKTRKEEAEKRLNNTEQNLTRINDIISTYEERIEPLRIENEKAKEFITLSEGLKTREVSLIIFSIEKIQEKLQIQKHDLLKIQQEIESLLVEKTHHKNELGKLGQVLEEHERKNSSERDEYYNLKNIYQGTKSEIDLLSERIVNLTSYVDRTLKELQDLKVKAETLQTQKASMELELQTHIASQSVMKKDIVNFESSIEALNKSINLEEEKRNKLREEAIELLRKVSENKNGIILIQNNMESTEKKLQQINSSYDNFVTSIKINSSTKSALEKEISKLSQEISNEDQEIKFIKKEIHKLTSELSTDELNLKQLNVNLNKMEANHSLLLNFEKQFEGYTKAVKNLMQHIESNRIPEALNNTYVLGNIIKVDSRFETAIEIALGGAISDVITKDEGIAKKLIGYLKQNSLGRATFLPLNILQYRQLNLPESVKSLKGFIGIASELITYEEQFLPAVRYVLGRTIIANDMEAALSIAKAGNYSYKIVTLTGEVVNPGGSLTGGSVYHKSTNIIGRKREIEEIQIRVNETRQAIDISIKKIEGSRAQIKDLDAKVLNLKDEIHYKHIEITKIQGKIAALSEESEKLKLSLSTSKDEIETLNRKIVAFNEDLKEKGDIVNRLVAKEKENEADIENSENLVKETQVQVEEIKGKYMEVKIKKAQIDEVVLNKVKELERMSKELEGFIERQDVFKNEVNKSEQDLEKNKTTIIELTQKLSSIEASIKGLEERFQSNEIYRIDIKDKIKKLEENFENTSNVMLRREEEKHKLEIVCARQESEKDALFTKLNEEFQLTYAEAEKFRLEIINMDKLKSEITNLKGKITSLGTVNLGAIEEYEQIKEKYTFMNEQREDLIKAKQEIINVITEMTSKMKEVFNENFKKLKENFNETFKELFKGGSADLLLSEGDELTANIDINVQPPGKKLQNINLMSGGEKVLSAIALLFAILKMKPTPFCILDEIEAALDDANVARYAEFLKKFSKNIQFIVITHRKGTMEASDILYGVTMEEKGVSKIVSVDLSAV